MRRIHRWLGAAGILLAFGLALQFDVVPSFDVATPVEQTNSPAEEVVRGTRPFSQRDSIPQSVLDRARHVTLVRLGQGDVDSTTFVDPSRPTVRQRAVAVDIASLAPSDTAVGDSLALAFFDDVRVNAVIVSTHENITGTHGYIAEDVDTDSLLFVTVNEDRVLVTVVGERAAYQLVHSTTTDSHFAMELDLTAMSKAECGNDRLMDAMVMDGSAEAQVSEVPRAHVGGPRSNVCTIDYMATYTADAVVYADANQSGINNVITQALLKTNNALQVSEAQTQVNLVKTLQVSYPEPASYNKNFLSTALNKLTNETDGIIDNIHAEREASGADLVSIFVYNFKGAAGTYTAGRGWTPNAGTGFDKSLGFTAVEVFAGTGYTLAHELGHNLGCQHARDVLNAPNSPDPRNAVSPAAYGYTINDAGTERTTVMGYALGAKIQLPYFSNPAIRYNSIPIGSAVTPQADNAGVIRGTSGILVCNYFGGGAQQGSTLMVTQGNAEHVEARWTPVDGAIGYGVEFSYDYAFEKPAGVINIWPHITTASSAHWSGWDGNSWPQSPLYVRVRPLFAGGFDNWGDYSEIVPGWIMRDSPGAATLELWIAAEHLGDDNIVNASFQAADFNLYRSEPSFFWGVRPVNNPQPMMSQKLAGDSVTFSNIGFGTYWYDFKFVHPGTNRIAYQKGQVSVTSGYTAADIAEWTYTASDQEASIRLSVPETTSNNYGTLTILCNSSNLGDGFNGIDYQINGVSGFSRIQEAAGYGIRAGQHQGGTDYSFFTETLAPGTYTVVANQVGGELYQWGPYQIKIEKGRAVKLMLGERESIFDIFEGTTDPFILYPIEQTKVLTLSDGMAPLRRTAPSLTAYYLVLKGAAESNGYVEAGTDTTITAEDSPPGQSFSHWTSTGGGSFGDANSPTTTFTVPSSAAEVTANYVDNPSHTLTVASGGDSDTVAAGLPVTITADAPPEGQEFSHWTSSNGGELADFEASPTTFVMPDNDTTVTAVYRTIGSGDLLLPLRAIACGQGYSLMVTNSGELWGMGDNGIAQITGDFGGFDVPLTKMADNVQDVAATSSTSFYLTTDGELWGKGNDTNGQLGVFYEGFERPWVKIADNVIALAGGNSHALYVNEDNELWGMGASRHGELGVVTEIGTYVVPPRKIADNVATVSGGYDHTLYVTTSGQLYGMGDNGSGQLGLGDEGDPINQVTNPLLIASGVTKAEAASDESFYITTSGSLYTMGEGQRTPELLDTGVANVNSMYLHTLYSKANGDLYVYGFHYDGSLGLGPGGAIISDPEFLASDVYLLATGLSHSLYVTSTGLYGMGDNWSGALGDTLSDDAQLTPVSLPIPGPQGPHQVTFDLGEHGTWSGGGGLSQIVEHGQAALEPTVYAEHGWAFGYWDTLFDEVTETVHATALYEQTIGRAYVVNFVGGSRGSVLGPTVQYVPPGTDAAEPPVSANDGWEFTGWDTTFTDVDSDLTVTALFESLEGVSHTVTFDPGVNGTTTGELVQFIPTGGSAFAPEMTANDGWVFIGWDLPFANIIGDLTVTAQYQEQLPPAGGSDFTVIFAPGAHGQADGLLVQTVDAGNAAQAPVVTADHGWRFIGWDIAFTNVQSNLTTTAQYMPPTYTVTFELGNGFRSGGGALVQTVAHGSKADAPVVIAQPGFSLAGFDPHVDGFITEDTTITAVYVPASSYQLTVAGGFGSGTVTAGLSTEIIADDPPQDLVFSHWTSSAGGSFADFTAATTTFNMPSSATTVTANFTDEFTANNSYDLDVLNGTGSGRYVVDTVVDIVADPPPAGHAFSQWTATHAGVDNTGSAITTFTVSANPSTVTANYEPLEFAVNDGVGQGSVTFEIYRHDVPSRAVDHYGTRLVCRPHDTARLDSVVVQIPGHGNETIPIIEGGGGAESIVTYATFSALANATPAGTYTVFLSESYPDHSVLDYQLEVQVLAYNDGDFPAATFLIAPGDGAVDQTIDALLQMDSSEWERVSLSPTDVGRTLAYPNTGQLASLALDNLAAVTTYTVTVKNDINDGRPLSTHTASTFRTAAEHRFSVGAGWSFVSVPFDQTLGGGRDVGGDLVLDSPIWRFDNVTGRYEPLASDEPMRAGIGYFLHSSAGGSSDLMVGIERPNTVDLERGWNGVGVVRDVDAPRRPRTVWGFDGTRYFRIGGGNLPDWQLPGTLMQGHGYWIFSRTGGELPLE